VNALDKALRRSIERRFPEVHDIHLVNYSVRILDEDRARRPRPGCSSTPPTDGITGGAWEWE